MIGTVAEFKSWCTDHGLEATQADARIERALTVASKRIASKCHRQLEEDSEVTVYTFVGDGSNPYLYVDEMTVIETVYLVTAELTSEVDYRIMPEDGPPYYALQNLVGAWPIGVQVSVHGKRGYLPEIPEDLIDAVYMEAARNFWGADGSIGVQEVSVQGVTVRLGDADRVTNRIAEMIDAHVRRI